METVICIRCKGTGMTGWHKPMGPRPDGSINMVFVPQVCACNAGYRIGLGKSKPDTEGTGA